MTTTTILQADPPPGFNPHPNPLDALAALLLLVFATLCFLAGRSSRGPR